MEYPKRPTLLAIPFIGLLRVPDGRERRYGLRSDGGRVPAITERHSRPAFRKAGRDHRSFSTGGRGSRQPAFLCDEQVVLLLVL